MYNPLISHIRLVACSRFSRKCPFECPTVWRGASVPRKEATWRRDSVTVTGGSCGRHAIGGRRCPPRRWLAARGPVPVTHWLRVCLQGTQRPPVWHELNMCVQMLSHRQDVCTRVGAVYGLISHRRGLVSFVPTVEKMFSVTPYNGINYFFIRINTY